MRVGLGVAWAPPAAYAEDRADGPTAPGVPWYHTPVVGELHPVGYHYGVRYQEVLAETLGGWPPNPAWSPMLTRADLHYRLIGFSGQGLDITREEADRWRDLAVSGVLMSVETVAEEAAWRGDHTRAVFVTLDSLVGPGLEIRGGDDPEVRGGVGGARQRVTRDLVEEDRGPRGEAYGPARSGAGEARDDEGRRATRPPPPRDPVVRTGFGWHLRGAEEPPDAPAVDYATWLFAENVGITTLRLDYLVLSDAWSLAGRQQLWPHLSLTVGAESVPDDPMPMSWKMGILVEVPRLDGWSLRLERVQDLATSTFTWRVAVRNESGCPIPGRPGGTFGVVDDEPPALPWVPERGPLPVVRIDVPPEARGAAAEPVKPGRQRRR